MANTFKKATFTDVKLASSTVYTVPALTQAVIIGFIISNKTSSEIFASASAGGVQITGLSTKIPAATALSILDGKIVLDAGDVVTVTTNLDDVADCYVSVMEIT